MAATALIRKFDVIGLTPIFSRIDSIMTFERLDFRQSVYLASPTDPVFLLFF